MRNSHTFLPCMSCTVTVLAVLVSASLLTAPQPTIAAKERIPGFHPRTFAVVKATLVTAPGQSVPHGTVLIRDGRISAAGTDVIVPPGAELIDGENLFVYAGFLDAATTDLIDPDKTPTPVAGRDVNFSRYVLAATRPDNRKSLTPEYRAAENLKLDDKSLDALRTSGFTDVHVLPADRIAAGQGALLTTSGLPPRESVVLPSTFGVFQLFAPRGGSRSGSAYPTTLMGATAHLRQAFLDAGYYKTHWDQYRSTPNGLDRPPTDAALEALNEVLSAHRRAVFIAQTRDDVHRALNFAGEHHLAPLLWGCREAYRALDRLKRENVELIVQVDFGEKPKIEPALTPHPSPSGRGAGGEGLSADVKDPLRAQQDHLNRWNERVAGLADLHKAGIRFSLSSRGLKNPDELLKNLRLAIDHGLPRDAALAALTVDAAAILGVEDQLGTLSPGKLGHVIVMTGPFDQEKSKVRYVFVGGQRFEYNEDAKPVAPAEPSGKEPTSEPSALAGRWHMEIDSAEGKVTAELTLAQRGGKLTGTFTSEQGNGKLTSGSIKDNAVRFVVSIGAGDREVLLKFSGRLSDEQLTGELKSAFGSVTQWTARKAETASHEPDSHATDQSNPVRLASPRTANTAAKPAEAPKPDALPTELQSDRLSRPIQTGGNVLIKNGTVLTGTGTILSGQGTSILVKDGKIAGLGANLKPEEGMTVIDATGRYVIPGIIDTHSHIMISGGVNEYTQSIVPEVRIKDVVNTDDVAEYRALAGGVTAARLLHGSANVIGGQDAVVKLKYGATADEQILHDAPQGVKFALGENVKRKSDRFPNTRLGVEATLRRAFLEARDYRRQWQEYQEFSGRPSAAARGEAPPLNGARTAVLLPPRRDLRLEALADILDHKKFIHSHCYRADEILMLLRVASSFGVRVWSLQHVLEGYKVAPEIAAHGASCSTFADWWAYKVEAYDATPYNAALLHEAGVNTVIKSDDPELIRHLYQEAAKTVRYGNMPPEAALQAITRNPAQQLGLDKRMGTIEVGKDADLAIFSGHPLNAFSRCEMTLIDGEVYFSREDAPSAMSAEAEKHSAHPPELLLPPAKIQRKRLDLKESPTGRYAIVGATLHPVDGADVADGVLLVNGGKITAIGTELDLPSNTKVIDAKGLHVYPGLIDAGTTLGLTEIRMVEETHDYSESGFLQPDIRAGVAINPDSALIPAARAGGITTVLIQPTGGLIAGQASVAKLAGWTAPEMVMNLKAGLVIMWPNRSDDKEQKAQIKQLREFFQQARLYGELRNRAGAPATEPRAEPERQRRPIADPRMDAMQPYLAGGPPDHLSGGARRRPPVFIEAHRRKHIAEALLFAEQEKLSIVITGGTEAWKIADELKARNVPVIVGPVMRSPLENYDPFDAPYANPGRLYEAGVKFCIRSDNASNSRNAPFEAAEACAYGLPPEEGLRAVTLSAAEILGLADQLGSLTPGKRANVIITDGSPLQPTTHIKGIFIDGQPFAPESKQTRLYERYRRRLHEVQTGKGRSRGGRS